MPLSKKHNYPYQKFTFSFIIFLHFILTGTRYNDLDDSDEKENENEKVSEDSSPVNTTDILGMLFNTESWIGTKNESENKKNYFNSFVTKAQLLTEFPVFTGTSRHSRRK